MILFMIELYNIFLNKSIYCHCPVIDKYLMESTMMYTMIFLLDWGCIKDVLKILSDVVSRQGINKHVFVLGGGKTLEFWPKYLPLHIGHSCGNYIPLLHLVGKIFFSNLSSSNRRILSFFKLFHNSNLP